MRQVTLQELGQLVTAAREEIWTKAESLGREPKIYLHWSAGRYETPFEDYHINISGAGKIWVSTDDMSQTLAHTWKRNTGSIGISLCAAYCATSEDLGEYEPTDIQIEVMAQCICEVADALWLTIDPEHIQTHGEAADNAFDDLDLHDPYGPQNGCERWDLQYLGTPESPKFVLDYEDPATGGNVLRGKANWYRNLKEESRDE